MITAKTTKVWIVTPLIGAALIGAGISAHGRPKNESAENACLDQYDVCYNNCKGKSDVCYSNCDTVYEHCMHGAGTPGFIKVRKHPRSGQEAAPHQGLSSSTATPKTTVTVPPTNFDAAAAKKQSSSATKTDNATSTRYVSPTPTPKKSHQ